MRVGCGFEWSKVLIVVGFLAVAMPVAPAAANAPPTCTGGSATIRQDKPIGGLQCQDSDGDEMTLTILEAPEHGEVGFAPDGTYLEVTYDPDDGYRGRDSFRAAASDGAASSAPFEMALRITRNHAPVCPRNTVGTPVGTPLETSLLGCFDTDTQDGGRLTVALDPAAPPAHGTLSPADRGVTYTPDPGYSGADDIGVMATDGDLVAREVIRVHVADTTFCTPDDPVRVRPGHGAEAQVACTTPDNRSTVLSIVAQPAKGVASQQWFGVSLIRYQASSLESGADSFTFRATSEDSGVSPVATQEIVLDPAFNRAPSCNEHDIPYVARAEEATDIRLFCSDADVDPLTYEVTKEPAGGSATVDGDTVTYTSDSGSGGLDEVGVTVKDDHGGKLELMVPVEVLEPGGPACAAIPPITVRPSGVGFVTLECEDASSYEIVDGPDQGIVEAKDPPGRFRYVAASWAAGTDTFKLRGVDATGPGAPVTVQVTLDPSFNSAPMCGEPDVRITVARGATRLLPLEFRCGDPEGDPMTYAVVAQGSHGSVAPGAAASLSYTADGDYVGPDSFTYTASDDRGATSAVRRFDMEVVDDGTTSTPTPTPTPTATPLPPPDRALAADTAAPALELFTQRQSLESAAGKGVKVAFHLDEPATLELRVSLARAAARRLGLASRARKAVVVGRATRAAAAGDTTVRVRLERRARRALRRARRVRLTLAIEVKDAAGNVTSRTRHLTLRR